MSSALHARLNQILPKITSESFLSGEGIGNEIAFYIFDYPPDEELPVREHVAFLLEQIPKKRPGTRVAHVHLFEFLLAYLEKRGLLQKALQLQRSKGDEALMKALKGPLHEEKISRHFVEEAKPDDHDLVLISGVGSAYPMLRPHTLLHNLATTMGQTPLVMFYPGFYHQGTLQPFGKAGPAGHSPTERQETVNYYRAFRLIDDPS